MANTPVAITGAVTIVGYSVTLPFVTTDSYTFSFPYLSQDDFEIEVKSETILDAADYTFTSDYLIQLTTTGVNKLNALYGTLTDVPVTIRRRTQVTTRLVDYQDGATLTEADLDLQANQLFYLVQEVYDNSELGNVSFNPVDGSIDIDGVELVDLAEPTAESSAATLKTVLDNCVTPDYTTGEDYRENRMVFSGTVLYRSNKAVTTAPAILDVADWDEVLDTADAAILAAGIATNVTDIGTNATNIATNVTNIGTNVTDIGTNASNLTAHEAENETAHTERDTKANLDTWALTATNGAMAYATDEKLPYIVKDTLLEAVGAGGGGGSLEIYHQETFEDTVAADFVTGNNAAPDAAGTGTLDGTLSDDTTTPLSALSSLKYVMGATSTNDFFLSPAITVDELQTDKDSGIKKYYDYNGADGDIKVIVLDQADNILTSTLDLLDGTSANKRFEVGFFIGPSVTSIRYGVQVVTGNSGKILRMDNVEFSTNPFVYKNLVETSSIQLEGNDARVITANTEDVHFSGSGTGWTSTGDTHFYTVQKNDSVISISACVRFTATVTSRNVFIYKNGSSYKRIGSDVSGGSALVTGSYTSKKGEFVEGDELAIHESGGGTLDNNARDHYLNIVEQWETEHVVTPAKSNLTDFIAYTPTFQGLGTVTDIYSEYRIIGDSVEVSINGRTGTCTSSEVQISLPNSYTAKHTSTSAVSVGRFTRNEASADNNNNVVLITNDDAFINIGRLDSAGTTPFTPQGGTSIIGNSALFSLRATVPVNELSSDATFLAAIPVQKVAFLKDVKTSGTSGGSTTANTVQTRDLNTVSGDSEIVSLSTNQFTLSSGKYSIESEAPCVQANRHQIFLYNVTDSTYDIDGVSAFSSSTDAENTIYSILKGEILVTASKTYEIRHWTQATKASIGLGLAADNHASNPQSGEVYTQVKITKLR